MTMGLNVGKADRILRIVIGGALISLAFSPLLLDAAAMAAYVVGAVAVFTGIVRFCPAYTVFGVNTGRTRS